MRAIADKQYPDAGVLSQGLAQDIDALCAELLPQGKREGSEWRCGDVQGNPGQSLGVRLTGEKAGCWKDFNSGEGGDALDLVRLTLGLQSPIEAKDWAAAWLNIDTPQRERVNGSNGAARPAPANHGAPQGVPEGIRKARAYAAKMVPIAGTAAEWYLASRGIAAAELTSDIGFLPNAWRHEGQSEGALVVVARDGAGDIGAAQLVYLLGNRKATPDEAYEGVVKRTYGPIGQAVGWCVPATAEQAERVIFTEGPENALTAAQATGLEARATCGKSNFASVIANTVAAGETRQIVIGADPFAKSIADPLDKQVAKLCANGIEVLVAQHPKYDLNELLQIEGADAVRALLDSAAAPDAPEAPDSMNNALADDARPPDFADETLALQFAAQHADRMRFVSVWNRWLIYDGVRWCPDETLQAFDFSRAVCREASALCEKPGTGRAVASAKTVAAVERLAKSDRRLAATVGMWDADPWLLNTPDCVIDLRTGKRIAHQPSHYMTKVTAVGPCGDCPLWRRFLDRITAGDQELQGFLQRVVGYSLTGSTREHAIFFCYGTGANGKSVLMSTIAGILGDYHRTASMDVFVESRQDRHPTELANLHGARMVSASETEEGRRWAESKIKELTGGDRISARLMRQDFFEFIPQFKLLIAGNHRPQLRNVDEAMRRRLHLIPFTVTIPKAERDASLTEKLRAEWPGIMAWALEGAVTWARDGLQPPATVVDATAEYIAEEDTLSLWLSECCRTGGNWYSTTADLRESWRKFAERTGEPIGTQKWLSQTLRNRGFEPKRQGGTGSRGFTGIIIRPPDQSGQPYS